EFWRKVTDPSPRRALTPPLWADDKGVLQFGCSCQVAVTGGLGGWRTVGTLKHRPSVLIPFASCIPRAGPGPLPFGSRAFLRPLHGPLLGIAVRFWVFSRRYADCSATTIVFDRPSLNCASLTARLPGKAPPAEWWPVPDGLTRSVVRWLVLPAMAA